MKSKKVKLKKWRKSVSQCANPLVRRAVGALGAAEDAHGGDGEVRVVHLVAGVEDLRCHHVVHVLVH